jgi:hypothetical protein
MDLSVYTQAMRALDELVRYKGVFGGDAGRRVADLLAGLARARLQKPAELIGLHETALYFRAYPHSPRVLRLAENVLRRFEKRLDGEEFAGPEVSGIAGASVSSNFSYEFARSLAGRHGRDVRIDWENYERPDRLGPVLAGLLPGAREVWSVEPHVDWRRWFQSAGCTLPWLLERVEPAVYDLLEIPIRWDLGGSRASRTRLRIPRRSVFYHKEPLLRRRDVSIEAEFAAPKIQARRLTPAEGRRIADVLVDASAVRYRELWGFVHPDVKRFYHADLGRGVDYYFGSAAREWRLPMRGYHSGMFFKNGVPAGYFEGLSMSERMEAGFNLYYTFREGETAWIYARLLKLYRERAGVICFTIDPYQLGHDNEEAIESGAFWFYRKLGFRPATPDAAQLAAREEEKIAARPDYRTPPSVLRRLAESPMMYGCAERWGRFSIQDAALKVDRRLTR